MLSVKHYFQILFVKETELSARLREAPREQLFELPDRIGHLDQGEDLADLTLELFDAVTLAQMLVKPRLASAPLVDLGVDPVEFFKNRPVRQWLVHIGSGELGEVLRTVLDDGTGSGGRQPFAAIKPVQFVIVFIWKLLFPFPTFFLDVLLDQNAERVGAANLLEAGGLVDQSGDANLSEGIQQDLGLLGQSMLG